MTETIRIKDSNGAIKTLYEVLPPARKLERCEQKVSKLYVVPQKKEKSQNDEPNMKEIEKIVFVDKKPQDLVFEVTETPKSGILNEPSSKKQKDRHPYIIYEDPESKNQTLKNDSTKEKIVYIIKPTNDSNSQVLVPKLSSPNSSTLPEIKPLKNGNVLEDDNNLKKTNNQTFFELYQDPNYFGKKFIKRNLSSPNNQPVMKTLESKPFNNGNVLEINDENVKPIEKHIYQNQPVLSNKEFQPKSNTQYLFESKPFDNGNVLEINDENIKPIEKHIYQNQPVLSNKEFEPKSNTQYLFDSESKTGNTLQEKAQVIELTKKSDEKQQQVEKETVFIKNEPMSETLLEDHRHTRSIWPWLIFLPLASIFLSGIFLLIAISIFSKKC
jgi:hypothetical protein